MTASAIFMGYRLSGGLMQMARKQQAEQRAEHRRQHEEEERRQRAMVITDRISRSDDAVIQGRFRGRLVTKRPLLMLLRNFRESCKKCLRRKVFCEESNTRR
jgi:hypothetical protein